ncbi:MAG: NUDIX domain-containing protein [Proteobacteria bacterium]|nr:NUDIX domain-containing protein [Pseudomonadota bacterium]
MPDKPLFLFGTLRHPPVLEAVAGALLPYEPATLADHAVTEAQEPGGGTLHFPLLVARPGAEAQGALIRPGAEARARLDLYERIFEYHPVPVIAQTPEGPVEALLYQTAGEHWLPGPDWSLDAWAAGHGALAAEVAGEVMALSREHPPAVLRRRYPLLAGHVASRHRARDEAAPATRRRVPGADDVTVEGRRTPYAKVFAVEENRLRLRQHDGGLSTPVDRAAFLLSDAVTLLPYDPARDLVLLVEQFRFAPFLRADANPWTLEAIAGRVDAGETPEEAARREAVEEAGLSVMALHSVARYYSSPGAVTEFLYSYVALVDLPEGAEGKHGLVAEAEDIRTHRVPFTEAMAMIDTGEVANGPLVISLQWLALNRARLGGPQSA